MSMRDKVKGIFQIDGGDDEFYDDDEGYLDEPEPIFKKSAARDADDSEESGSIAKRVTRVARNNRKTMGNGMEVCVVKPTAFEDAREITETLLDNRTVVLNLEGLDVDIAQRIIDFASGSCFAMRGNLQKISHYIFIITPPTVDISGDFADLISGTLDVEISR